MSCDRDLTLHSIKFTFNYFISVVSGEAKYTVFSYVYNNTLSIYLWPFVYKKQKVVHDH